MERRLWRLVYQMLIKIDRARPAAERSVGVMYSDVVIAAVYFWTVIHDRTQEWACLPINWPHRPGSLKQLPTPSTLSRRLRSTQVSSLINRLEAKMRAEMPHEWCLIVDGKSLPVGGYSKDPDAKVGYGAGYKFRGYKLHAINGGGRLPWSWDVLPANVSEPTTAVILVDAIPGEGYLLGDASYDSNRLYAAAWEVQRHLIAPRKRPGTGLGHGSKHHPQRLRSIELTEEPELHPFAEALHNWRSGIERQFGWLTQGTGGLTPLPPHVRRLSRVRRWVQAKIILNNLSP